MLPDLLIGILIVLGWIALKIILPALLAFMCFFFFDLLLFPTDDKNNFKR